MNTFFHPTSLNARIVGLTIAVSLAAGCGEGTDPMAPGSLPASELNTGSQNEPVVDDAPWSCQYTNPFSSALECKDFTGSAWTAESALADCDAQPENTFADGGCSTEAVLGQCAMASGSPLATVLVFPGEDESQCAITQQGCEVFAGGAFTPSATCENTSEMLGETPPMSSGSNVFYPPEYICSPSQDDTPGVSDGDEVCTWQSIGGCTEPGRVFTDYAACEPVLTQRPFFPVPPSNFKTEEGDPLYEDETYLAEVAWVKSEAESCGCVCCHTTELGPRGAAAWDTAAEGIWTDSFTERGLAIAAGWVDSSPLGAHAAIENNGFDRSITGLPTTDSARMIRFFEGELSRRGVDRSSYEGAIPVGGPLYTQGTFTPAPCEMNEGIDANDSIRWTGGAARYVFILTEGSDNPGVPPNLDKPAGTLWKLDVDSRTDPINSGLSYGTVPANAFQTIPAEGDAPTLIQGERYYLYVLADVGAPITRCTFVYENEAAENLSESGANAMEETTPTVTGNWEEPCTEDSDCVVNADYCVKMPGDTDGYCSTHCDSRTACAQAGAPESWTCNAVSCALPDFTWCGPPSEIADSGNFLSLCE